MFISKLFTTICIKRQIFSLYRKGEFMSAKAKRFANMTF